MNQILRDIAHDRESTKLDILYLRACWDKANKGNTGVLTKREILSLLQTINISMSPRVVEAIFRKVDKDNNGVLDFSEFSNFVQVLRRRFMNKSS